MSPETVEPLLQAEPRDRSKDSGDDLIQAAVVAALRQSGYRPLGQLEIDVFDGVVVLTGSLPSFHLKQTAQEAVLKLGLASQIVNKAEVAWPVDDSA